MLDLLHFYFEEDNTYSSEDSARSQSRIRESLYESMYGRTYKYKYVESKQSNEPAYSLDEAEELPEEDLKPFDPLSGPPKEYFAPTELNESSAKPFGSVLDAPLG